MYTEINKDMNKGVWFSMVKELLKKSAEEIRVESKKIIEDYKENGEVKGN